VHFNSLNATHQLMRVQCGEVCPTYLTTLNVTHT